MLVVAFAAAATLSTLIGGIVGLRHQAHLSRILGFTAGVLLGVVAFDVLPEVFELVEQTGIAVVWPMLALVIGFLLIHVVEKLVLLHHAHEHEYVQHTHPQVGVISAAALISHSFLDGVAIGLGFQAGEEVGLAVAVAVIAHDFSDGLNTVGLMLHHRNSDRRSFRFLVVGALAPIAGAASTFLFELPDQALAIYLGGFAGFLLYIGAADILPQAHSSRPSGVTMALTVLGAASMLAVSQVAGA